MTVLMACVEKGQIAGINREVLIEAYQVLENSNCPKERKDRLRSCIVQLTLHLLQDPDRVSVTEFKHLTDQVRVLTTQKNELLTNAKQLTRKNEMLENQMNEQQRCIDDLARELLRQKEEVHLKELELIKKSITFYEEKRDHERLKYRAYAVLLSIGLFIAFPYWSLAPIPTILAIGYNGPKPRLDLYDLQITYWKRVEALIKERGLLCEEAKRQIPPILTLEGTPLILA